MKASDILNRLTGISCPVFGISWNPPETQRSIARKTILFLEARRVLFQELNAEFACHCVTSIIEIKDFLTSILPDISEGSELEGYIRSMRNACNTFLSKCPIENKKNKCDYCKPYTLENMFFVYALGELRGVFGIMIGQISKAFGIDVEDNLAQIIPE